MWPRKKYWHSIQCSYTIVLNDSEMCFIFHKTFPSLIGLPFIYFAFFGSKSAVVCKKEQDKEQLDSYTSV
jgi:hypothetical protein